MKKISSFFPFSLAIFFTIFGTVFLPSLRLATFSPFFVFLYHRTTYIKALWISLACGLLLDAFTSQFRFGLYALDTSLTTFLLYSQKRHFFEDKPIALSTYSALISCVQSILFLLLSIIFEPQFSISIPLLLSDLIIMPFLDAIYAFLCFTCPIMMYQYIRKFNWRRWLYNEEE